MYYSLDKEKVVDKHGKYKHYSNVYDTIEKNKKKSRKLIDRYNFKGIFSLPHYDHLFSLSGSLLVSSLEDLKYPNIEFLENNHDRFFIKKGKYINEYHLRGPRYVIALDSQYSVIQKLDILVNDLNDCIKYINEYKVSDTQQFKNISVILDYLKNSLITLFNSYVHKEKLGCFKFKDENYQENRKHLIEAIKISVYAYYLSLCDMLDNAVVKELTKIVNPKLGLSISNTIKEDFRNFSFSSKSLVRPEATHPLVLISYAINICNKFRDIDYVFGLPSGSTEISCLIQQISEHFYKSNKCELCLLPMSFHSINDFKKVKENVNYSNFQKLLPIRFPNEINKKGLIIDDNSATGKTIETVHKVILNGNNTINLISSVAEADLIRINQKLKSDLREENKYCHPTIFKHSVSILPISSIIRPKFDLKEIIERRLLYNFYLKKDSKSLSEQIVNEVIANSIEYKIEDYIENLNETNSVLSFKHTFLSNFYAVDFVYKGRKYFSVEQAYLRQKFDSLELKKLKPFQKNELNEILLIKGINVKKNDFSTAFYDNNLPAGVLKRWSYKLKEWGLEDKHWDDKRLNIMCELLLLKYTQLNMIEKLLNTGDLYLVEGNDWNDTFWGVCENHGRNFLGRLIMNIRQKLLLGGIDLKQISRLH